jgi:hypothetical protein
VNAADDPGRAKITSASVRFLRGFRLIPRIDTYPAVVSFAQTIIGRLTLLGVFGVGSWYWYTNPHWKLLILILTAMTGLPQHRRIVLTCGTLLWAYGMWWRWTDHPLPLQAAIVMGLAALLFRVSIRFRQSWFGRRPLASLLIGYALSVFLASYLPRGGYLRAASWDLLTVAETYIWFIAYSLLDSGLKSRDPFALQLGTFHPFWGSTSTPFVKGAAYLRRIEAHSPEQLAVAQLKGLKLLAWSVILGLFLHKAFQPFVHGYLGIPEYSQLFKLSVQRAPFPWYVGWASLISNFIEGLGELCIWGHRIVAACRMAGFLALRNTYRPLESRSIAEFWNRYYYYFKELLVDCFFYPTFMRYFKRFRRLRLFAATFAAACFGNAFYHFFGNLRYIEDNGFWKALAGFDAYIFYTVVLALGIGISQTRERRIEATGWVRGRLVPTFCTIVFFCILHVFDYSDKRYPIQECFRFLGHLFNLIS